MLVNDLVTGVRFKMNLAIPAIQFGLNMQLYACFENKKIVIENIAQKLNFPLRISSANVTKSAVSCGFGHIY